MKTYLVTYHNGHTETIRGYNLLQALGTITGWLDEIKQVVKQ